MISKIFATPSEPLFNHEEFSLSREVLEESLNVLAQENDHLIDTATEWSGFFKEGSPVGKCFNRSSQSRVYCRTK